MIERIRRRLPETCHLVFTGVNAYRKYCGLDTLDRVNILDDAAHTQVIEVGSTGILTHTHGNPTLSTVKDRANWPILSEWLEEKFGRKLEGVKFRLAEVLHERVWHDDDTPESIANRTISAWLKSRDHHAAIIERFACLTGVATVVGERGGNVRFYCAQTFFSFP